MHYDVSNEFYALWLGRSMDGASLRLAIDEDARAASTMRRIKEIYGL